MPMKVTELNRRQLRELKRFYWNEKRLKEANGATFAEFEIIDDLVSDEEIFKAFSFRTFEKDDFVQWPGPEDLE